MIFVAVGAAKKRRCIGVMVAFLAATGPNRADQMGYCMIGC